MKNNDVLIVYTDGGARGNPGPAACAFVISKDGSTLYKGSKYLGVTTNNVAEYSGLIIALTKIGEHLKNNSAPSVKFFLDSELVVKQLLNIYKVKDLNLIKLYSKAKEIIAGLNTKVSFEHVLRSQNKIADSLVNLELDNSVKVSRP